MTKGECGGKETKNLNNGEEKEKWEENKTVATTKIETEIETEIDKNEIKEEVKLIRMVERYCKKCGRKTMHSEEKFKGDNIFQCIVVRCGRTIKVEK